jgi:hypothetical protein
MLTKAAYGFIFLYHSNHQIHDVPMATRLKQLFYVDLIEVRVKISFYIVSVNGNIERGKIIVNRTFWSFCFHKSGERKNKLGRCCYEI